MCFSIDYVEQRNSNKINITDYKSAFDDDSNDVKMFSKIFNGSFDIVA